ncbi:hypothetical protein [Undibacterium sp. Di26W]|uniref:hypothetical protein n=1 Tax=Undibacterium sp. Di26W TaxID=3413035 RepID=UPI003BF5FE25
MAREFRKLVLIVIWGAALAGCINAYAAPQEVRAKVRYEATLVCKQTFHVRPTLLRVKYRVPHIEKTDTFIVQVALLPHEYTNLASNSSIYFESLNKYALGLIALYQIPHPWVINEAVFSLPDWFCSPVETQGKLVMRMLPPNPEGQLGTGRLQVVSWNLE